MMTTENGFLPLSRFTVLDLTRVRSEPTCVRQLADWGANVIKVELPEAVEGNAGLGGPRHGSDFQNLHCNKRSMTLNLKAADGLKLFKQLVEKSNALRTTPPERGQDTAAILKDLGLNPDDIADLRQRNIV